MLKKIGVLAAIACFGFVATAQAESGAIAWGNGKSAKALGLPNQQAARAKAMTECGSDCRTVVFDKGQCGAIAVGGTGYRFLGTGASLSAAENMSLNECSSKLGQRGNCRVGVSACQ